MSPHISPSGHTNSVTAVAFGRLPDGRTLLATRNWLPDGLTLLATASGHTNSVAAVTFGQMVLRAQGPAIDARGPARGAAADASNRDSNV